MTGNNLQRDYTVITEKWHRASMENCKEIVNNPQLNRNQYKIAQQLLSLHYPENLFFNLEYQYITDKNPVGVIYF